MGKNGEETIFYGNCQKNISQYLNSPLESNTFNATAYFHFFPEITLRYVVPVTRNLINQFCHTFLFTFRVHLTWMDDLERTRGADTKLQS